MGAQHSAIQMDNLAWLNRTGAQPAHHIAVTPVRHKADILTVGFFSHRQPVFMRQRTCVVLGHAAQRKAQIIQLLGRRGEQEIGLVLARVGTTMQFRTVITIDALHIMASRKTVCLQITRGRQQVGEFHSLIAAHTGDRGFTPQIAVGKILHHLIMETAFIVQNVMRNAKPRRNSARIMYISAGTAGTLCLHGNTMIIKLQGYANDIIALFMQQRRSHRTVHTAGHGNNHPRFGRRFGKAKRVSTGRHVRICFWMCQHSHPCSPF